MLSTFSTKQVAAHALGLRAFWAFFCTNFCLHSSLARGALHGAIFARMV